MAEATCARCGQVFSSGEIDSTGCCKDCSDPQED